MAKANMDWEDLARCGEIGGDLFFPEKNQSMQAQKAVCAGCPVSAQCLEWALANDEQFGVWGGLSAAERRRITSRPAKAAA